METSAKKSYNYKSYLPSSSTLHFTGKRLDSGLRKADRKNKSRPK